MNACELAVGTGMGLQAADFEVDVLWMVSCDKWQHPNIQRPTLRSEAIYTLHGTFAFTLISLA